MSAPRVIVLNPNTSAASTAAMLAIARVEAPDFAFTGATGAFGAPFITNPAQALVGVQAVCAFCDALPADAADAVILSAFADPGLQEARTRLAIPVVGIAEAAMLVAAGIGRYSIVTTTPDLIDMIRGLAFAYGAGERLASIVPTVGDPVATMRDPTLLRFALEDACWRAIRADGAQAIVIGGGPLATAARALAGKFPVPLVEPVPCAVRRVRMLLAR